MKMKKSFLGIVFFLLVSTTWAQTFYPLASPCDPDRVYVKLPSAAYDYNCVYQLNITGQYFNEFPMEILRYRNLRYL